MRRWIWMLALAGCAESNLGEWEGETFDCVDAAMDHQTFTARVVYEPGNGAGSHEFDLDPALEAVGAGCTRRPVGLGLAVRDPVEALAQWRCEDGVIELWLDSSGTGDVRQGTLRTQTRRGTDRDPAVLVCEAELRRR